jgi:hypothetical protein
MVNREFIMSCIDCIGATLVVLGVIAWIFILGWSLGYQRAEKEYVSDHKDGAADIITGGQKLRKR